jgi:hypothetical protein
VEPRGYLGIRVSGRHQAQDVDLSLAEARRVRFPAAAPWLTGGDENRIDRTRIEPSVSGLAAELPGRLLPGESPPVWPVLGHGMERVGAGDDA